MPNRRWVSESARVRTCRTALFRGEILAHLDVLPNVGFWVDHAHVRLIGAAVDEYSVVQLKEAILGIVLPFLNACDQQKSDRRVGEGVDVRACVRR